MSAKKENKYVNIKYIVAGNNEVEKKSEHEDATQKKTERDHDVTVTGVDKHFPDTCVETGNQSEVEKREMMRRTSL